MSCLVGEPLTDAERVDVIDRLVRRARQIRAARTPAELASLQGLMYRDRDRGLPWPEFPR